MAVALLVVAHLTATPAPASFRTGAHACGLGLIALGIIFIADSGSSTLPNPGEPIPYTESASDEEQARVKAEFEEAERAGHLALGLTTFSAGTLMMIYSQLLFRRRGPR